MSNVRFLVHPEVAQLASLLQEASALLMKHGESAWAEWLRKDAQRVNASDFYGVEHILLAFGGMGSINDLVLCPANSHKIQQGEVSEVNEKLHTLLQEIHGLAAKLAREEANASRGT